MVPFDYFLNNRQNPIRFTAGAFQQLGLRRHCGQGGSQFVSGGGDKLALLFQSGI